MIVEIVVGALVVVTIVLLVYLVTRKVDVVVEAVPYKVPMPCVKPTRVPQDDAGFTHTAERPTPPKAPVRKPTYPTNRSHYPTGNMPAQHDTQSSDLLATMIILDAIDDTKYYSPSVDTSPSQSYSSPTPSSYSSSDDSCSRSSYSSSDSSSSYSGSDSSSSSSSCD